MELFAFVILTILALASALVVVLHRNPVVCALALAFNLISIAGFYMLLNAQFIALLQVIVYAGAIMVLILFVIMLLNLQEDLHGKGLIQRWFGLLLSLGFAALLARALYGTTSERSFLDTSPGFGTVESVGTALFSTYFYAFEVISLLLVVAMIGAVLLAKRRL